MVSRYRETGKNARDGYEPARMGEWRKPPKDPRPLGNTGQGPEGITGEVVCRTEDIRDGMVSLKDVGRVAYVVWNGAEWRATIVWNVRDGRGSSVPVTALSWVLRECDRDGTISDHSRIGGEGIEGYAAPRSRSGTPT